MKAPRILRAAFSGLSLLWLASSLDGSGVAYTIFLVGSLAAGIIMGAYGSITPGVAAIVASITLSVILEGDVAVGPLSAAVASVILSGLRMPGGSEALSLIPPLAVALAFAYLALSTPDILASAAPRLPGDTGLFLAATLSSKTGVMLASVSTFLAASYLTGSTVRMIAEVAVARVAPARVAEAERAKMLEELRRAAAPGYVYWLLGLLIASLLTPYFLGLGLLGAALSVAAALYFRVLLSAIIEWRMRRILLFTWPIAAIVALLSGSPMGLVADAVGLPGSTYRDPLALIADPITEAQVEASLRRIVDLVVVAVRLFWGG